MLFSGDERQEISRHMNDYHLIVIRCGYIVSLKNVPTVDGVSQCLSDLSLIPFGAAHPNSASAVIVIIGCYMKILLSNATLKVRPPP